MITMTRKITLLLRSTTCGGHRVIHLTFYDKMAYFSGYKQPNPLLSHLSPESTLGLTRLGDHTKTTKHLFPIPLSLCPWELQQMCLELQLSFFPLWPTEIASNTATKVCRCQSKLSFNQQLKQNLLANQVKRSLD